MFIYLFLIMAVWDPNWFRPGTFKTEILNPNRFFKPTFIHHYRQITDHWKALITIMVTQQFVIDVININDHKTMWWNETLQPSSPLHSQIERNWWPPIKCLEKISAFNSSYSLEHPWFKCFNTLYLFMLSDVDRSYLEIFSMENEKEQTLE